MTVSRYDALAPLIREGKKMGGNNPNEYGEFDRVERRALIVGIFAGALIAAALFVFGVGATFIVFATDTRDREIDGCGVNDLGSDTGVAATGTIGTTGFACPPLGIFEGACCIDGTCVVCDCNLCEQFPGGPGIFLGNGIVCGSNTCSPGIGIETTGTTTDAEEIKFSRKFEDFFENIREKITGGTAEENAENVLAGAFLFLMLAPLLLPFVMAAAAIMMLVFFSLLSVAILANALKN